MGVIYCAPAVASYVTDVYNQRIKVKEQRGEPDLNALLRSGHTWTVE